MWPTLRVGLLFGTASRLVAFCTVSAGVNGDGRASVFGTLVEESKGAVAFSWELDGSTGSLLGSGVIWAAREDTRGLALVSRRQGEERVVLSLSTPAVAPLRGGLDAEERTVEGVFVKKPRMLCCLPVDGAADLRTGGRAGVRASAIVRRRRGC